MRKSLSILLLCVTVGMVSCEKNDAPEPKEPVLYMAGVVNSKDVQYAAIWKNGVEIALTDKTDPKANYVTTSIYVDDNNDVYVAGYTYQQNSAKIARVWKNGMATNLTDGINDAKAYSVFVSGNDVYVAGKDGKKAVLWKNGVATDLTDGTNAAEATSVFVSGNDVYIAGYEDNATTAAVAKVWKNGVATSLTDGTNDSDATSVFVSGNDVYVTGFEYNGTLSVAKVWKNGEPTSLTDGAIYSAANSVYASGKDVYVVVNQIDELWHCVAKLFKNGVEINRMDSDGQYGVYASSVFVK